MCAWVWKSRNIKICSLRKFYILKAFRHLSLRTLQRHDLLKQQNILFSSTLFFSSFRKWEGTYPQLPVGKAMSNGWCSMDVGAAYRAPLIYWVKLHTQNSKQAKLTILKRQVDIFCKTCCMLNLHEVNRRRNSNWKCPALAKCICSLWSLFPQQNCKGPLTL